MNFRHFVTWHVAVISKTVVLWKLIVHLPAGASVGVSNILLSIRIYWTAIARDMYSASAVDMSTKVFLLDVHDTGVTFYVIAIPVVYFMSLGSPAKQAST